MATPEADRILSTTPMTAHDRWSPVQRSPSPVIQLRTSVTARSRLHSTHIDYVLRNLGVRQLVVSGLLTDQCVESAIRDACDLGYLVTQVSDACATLSQERHDNSLNATKGYCRQVSTDALLAELSEMQE